MFQTPQRTLSYSTTSTISDILAYTLSFGKSDRFWYWNEKLYHSEYFCTPWPTSSDLSFDFFKQPHKQSDSSSRRLLKLWRTLWDWASGTISETVRHVTIWRFWRLHFHDWQILIRRVVPLRRPTWIDQWDRFDHLNRHFFSASFNRFEGPHRQGCTHHMKWFLYLNWQAHLASDRVSNILTGTGSPRPVQPFRTPSWSQSDLASWIVSQAMTHVFQFGQFKVFFCQFDLHGFIWPV